MKSKETLKSLGFPLILLALVMALCTADGFCAVVDEGEAIAIADLWYAMELNDEHTKIDPQERAARFDAMKDRTIRYLVSEDSLVETIPPGSEVLAYVVTYEPTGFVMVSGEDRIDPILVFDWKSVFRWDPPEGNFIHVFVKRALGGRWIRLKEDLALGVARDVHPIWNSLRSTLREMKSLEECNFGQLGGGSERTGGRSTYLVWDTALWAQGTYYNDTVIAQNGNTPGIPVGCTATAMAIKMRFHEWPITGNGSHSYDDDEGSVQYSHSVNFGSQTYLWSNMPTTSLTQPNAHVANLSYHCGVAVNMDYEVGGSGAWPKAASMNNYFRYQGSVDKWSNHQQAIIDSVLGGLPVVISSTSHTVLVCGYRDTTSSYFYLNCGWNGSSNGWYNLDQIPGGDSTIDYSCPYSQPQNYVYVDGAWAGTETGALLTPYNTLSEGNTAVPWDGSLWIKGGTYTGAGNVPITFSKAMTIRNYEGTVTIQ